jgi:putative SOS response-associated peptidase YedK
MCGRYSNAKDLSELMKLVDSVMRVAFFGPRYNIAPTQMAPVIFMENKKPTVKLMRWGLIPSWTKDESTGNALINARAETLNTRQAFRQAYQQRRCLVPADSFFEWQEPGAGLRTATERVQLLDLAEIHPELFGIKPDSSFRPVIYRR